MPWHVVKKGSQFCVHKGHTGTNGPEVACHPTRAAANAHLRALYANEPKAVEFLNQMDYLTAAFEKTNPFGRSKIAITDSTGVRRELDVEVADSHETRARGMVGRDAFEADGMLFSYEDDVRHAFHMAGVNVQVHIAWFNAAGECVDHVGMFTKDPWHYQPNAAYRWAIELPVTDGANFTWLDGSTLTV